MKFRNLRRFIITLDAVDEDDIATHRPNLLINRIAVGYDITYLRAPEWRAFPYLSMTQFTKNITWYFLYDQRHYDIMMHYINDDKLLAFRFDHRGYLIIAKCEYSTNHKMMLITNQPKRGWYFEYNPYRGGKTLPNTMKTFYNGDKPFRRFIYYYNRYELPKSMILLAEKLYGKNPHF